MARPAGADIEAAPIGWRAGLAARRPLAGRACPDGRPGGGGSARPRSGRSRDVRFRAPVYARFRPPLRSSARARTARSRVVRRGRVLPTRRDARFHWEATLSPGPGRRKARVSQPRDSASAGQTSGGGCSVADGLGPRYVQRVRDARTAPRTAIAPLDHAGSRPYGGPTGGARLPCAQSKGEPHDRCRGQCGGPGVSRWSR